MCKILLICFPIRFMFVNKNFLKICKPSLPVFSRNICGFFRTTVLKGSRKTLLGKKPPNPNTNPNPNSNLLRGIFFRHFFSCHPKEHLRAAASVFISVSFISVISINGTIQKPFAGVLQNRYS